MPNCDPAVEEKIYSEEARYTLGYHGTDNKASERILLNPKDWRGSIGAFPFLGEGIYFYENSRIWAFRWAVRKYGSSEAAVLKAIIILGKCLDLCDAETIELIRTAATELATRRGRPVKIGAVINHLSHTQKVDTVRAAQQDPHPNPVIAGAQLFTGFRIMICVKNIAMLQNIEAA